jgi:tetratricopeptide (TPR) repeat protein
MRRRLLIIVLLGGCILLVAANRPCAASEPFVEFLRALQKRGYGEQGLAYLDQIADRPDLPTEIQETLDLERSKCLRIAAAEAYDTQQRAARLAESKRLAEKFFTEHPTHPAAGTVLLNEGDEALARGEQRLALAHSARDKGVQATAYQEARLALSEARSRFEVAVARLKEKLDSLPHPAAASEKPDARAHQQREESALPWIEARSKSALSEYLLAQTYPDSQDTERVKLLKQAGRAFDSVYQECRGRQVGLLAHMWHGKTLEELGDAPEALDIYDEVLVAAPDGPEADPELAPLFGQAELFRLQLQAKTVPPMEIIKEGEQWLQDHKKWKSESSYQGIALEIVRARLRSAERFRLGAERTKGLRECVVALNTIGKVESEYRHEALLLRREIVAKMGAGATLSPPEALVLGDEAASDGNWTEAESFYRQTLELAAKSKDAKSQDAAKTRLAQALYRQAVDQYGARNMEKALALCGELVRDNPDTPLAEEASAVAVAAALAEYSAAAQGAKETAYARLDRVASYALEHWPNKPVADDARMALAQVALISKDYAAAEQRLAQVNSQSRRYPTALQILGQVRWKQFLTAKKSPDAELRAGEIAKLRDEAVSYLTTSLQRQRAAWQSASEPMPPDLFDTQLLLAEIQLEGQKWVEAAVLFEPLVQVLKSARPTTIDRSGQRALVGAIRAWLATGTVEPARDAAELLITISHDEELPNSVLVELAKLVGQEARKAAPATAPADQVTFAARQNTPLQELHSRLIGALAPRSALSIPQLMYLGDACVQLDRNDTAREIYQRLLASVDHDESAKAASGAAITGIRARLVRLLRSEGKLDEAAAQASALIKEHPNALEPLLEKGYILQSLAERDPRRYDECLAHWTDLRIRLQRSKTRPPEYYDVLYNAAFCLTRQARLNSSQAKALQAEQILKSTLTLSPKLNGPEMVAKYEALLSQAAALRAEPSNTTARTAGDR